MRLLAFNMAMDLDDRLEFAVHWIRFLAKRVEYIHVITMRAGRIELPENVSVYSVGKEKGYTEPRRAVEFYRHLFRILRENHIDVCFSHMIPIFTVLAAPVLRTRGIPIVTWYAHRQVTTVLRLAHYFSDRMVASAASSYRYKHDKLVVVGQGIDTDLFSPDGSTSEFPPLLLSVGRLSPIKDLPTLLEAVGLMRRHGNDIRCVLVGDVPVRDMEYGEALRQTVPAMGLEGVVQFVGRVPSARVAQWYRRCFAHINLCPTGALDKAALEPMACGKLSLVANEGFRETMGDWADWLLFKHGDPQDLTQKVERLLQLGEAERNAIGADLRQRVVERHGLERLTGRLMNIFETLR